MGNIHGQELRAGIFDSALKSNSAVTAAAIVCVVRRGGHVKESTDVQGEDAGFCNSYGISALSN